MMATLMVMGELGNFHGLGEVSDTLDYELGK